MGFHLRTLHGYFFHQEFWPNLNFLLKDQVKLVLNIYKIRRRDLFDKDMIFSQPTLKACNSPYMQYYCKQFFVLHSSEVIFLISDQNVKAKSNKNRNCMFYSLGNPKGHTLDNFFMLHILVITSPIN